MKIKYERYDDGDFDVLLTAENPDEEAILGLLTFREVDALGYDPDSKDFTIRFLEPKRED